MITFISKGILKFFKEKKAIKTLSWGYGPGYETIFQF